MERVAKITAAILALILTLGHGYPAMAKQGEGMRALIDQQVSVVECLCYQLRQALYDMCQNVNPLITDAVYTIAEQTKNREIMRSFNTWKEGLLSQFEGQAIFDSASNRLTINVASHGAPGSLEAFKHYWEEGRPTILLSGELKKLPRYKILHLLVVRKIIEFQFPGGVASIKIKEDSIKKGLVERLKINIFFSSMIKEYLFREYCNGLWKRIELSFL